MIDWNTFQTNLEDALNAGFSDSDDLANTIVDEYNTAMGTGSESVGGNSLLTFNDVPLRNGFIAMFNNCLANNVPLDSTTFLDTALIAYWTNATLTTTGIPEGFATVISNVVTVPGTIPAAIVPPNPTDTPTPFVDAIRVYFQGHLPTLQGLISGTAPGTPPPPISAPWFGYS